MKAIYSICTYLLIALGVGHTLMTPVFYPGFSADALWFAGTGLLLLLLGMVNVMAMRLIDRALKNLSIVANLIGMVFVILISIAVPEIQALIAAFAALGATIGSIVTRDSASQGIQTENA